VHSGRAALIDADFYHHAGSKIYWILPGAMPVGRAGGDRTDFDHMKNY
jgi:hypothetical protein